MTEFSSGKLTLILKDRKIDLRKVQLTICCFGETPPEEVLAGPLIFILQDIKNIYYIEIDSYLRRKSVDLILNFQFFLALFHSHSLG